MHRNIDYYNNNAKAFYEGTVNADMSQWRRRFENYLSDGAKILDAGCGSGRDSLAFINGGYEVDAFDASEGLCKLASELIGKDVRKLRFEDVDYIDSFDGIWACASLLHVDEEALPMVVAKLRKALKKDGVIYASFKYGNGRINRGDRVFTDKNEESAKELFEQNGFVTLECDISTDIRPDRADEKWINVIARKAH